MFREEGETEKDIANALAVSASTICKWITRKMPVERFEMFANHFGWEVKWIGWMPKAICILSRDGESRVVWKWPWEEGKVWNE